VSFFQKKAAFTFVEALIVTVIACSLMIAIQAFFSHAVRTTLKGQDNLDSIRAASQIFSSLRKDMLTFTSLSTQGAISTISLTSTNIPATATFSQILRIKKPKEVVTYSLVTSGSKKYVERVMQSPDYPTPQRKLFGVPRMKDFGVMYVRTPNKINSMIKGAGQLLVKLAIDSENERFATKELNLTSVFFSERLSDSDWNYLDF
jgi:competence protein ComGC